MLELEIHATGPGTAHVFLWTGDHASIPVFLSSCGMANDPPPDFGFTPCALTDGGIPPWSPDMSGRVVASGSATVTRAGPGKVEFDLTAGQADTLAASGSALISFETPDDEVQALFVPFDEAK